VHVSRKGVVQIAHKVVTVIVMMKKGEIRGKIDKIM
jgi:hypothetical protein